MKLTNKEIVIIISIVFIIFLAVGIYFYRKGKKQATIQRPPPDDPGSGTDESGNNTFGVGDAQIYKISDDLFKDMNGFNWAGHDAKPYQDLNGLSDTDFVKVYNRFNLDHQADSEETLKGWINSESYAFNDVVESIIDRMNRLNLI